MRIGEEIVEKQGDRNPLAIGDQLLQIVEGRNGLEIRCERKELVLVDFGRFLKGRERRTSIIERMSVEARGEEGEGEEAR